MLQKLNDAQMQAVTAPLCPVLVLAGAGSGKTRVLTNRIIYLVKECNVNPYNILAITFTNKAANEMKERLYDFECGAEKMHISTIHSFCATVLRREAQLLNRNSNFTIYTEEDKKSLLKKVVKSIEEDADGKLVDSFSNIIADMKNNATELIDVAEGKSNGQYEQLANSMLSNDIAKQSFESAMSFAENMGRDKFMHILREYQSKMAQNNALDFDDLLYYVNKIFQYPEVLARYKERYKYILIDEFQDTNRVQYDIFRMLAGRNGNIFVVGDDDQSIYSWRGADVKNILNFEKDFDNTKVYKLEQNYRSTSSILDVANSVIAMNEQRYDKKLWTENEKGVRVELHSSYSEQDECTYVLQQINNLRYNYGYKWSDFAILMRLNALSRVYEQQLNGTGIPYKIFGGFKFFERKEVKDILCYLQIIDNPSNSEALFRAFNAPSRRGIGDATMNKLTELSRDLGLSIIDVISDERNMMGVVSSSAIKKITEFYQLFERLYAVAKTCTLSQLISFLLSEVPFRQTYLDNNDQDRALNVDAFEQSVKEFDVSMGGVATLADFLQSASLVADKEGDNKSTDYVTLATVHAVKGLEFKCVFVIGLDEGIFPIIRQNNIADMQEERRLMYVAITRACSRLYLTRASSRFMYGQRKNMMASRYFKEVQQLLAPPKDPVGTGDYRSGMDSMRPIERPQPTQKKKVSYTIGQKVMHPTFGKGMVLNCVNSTVDVIFENVGKKTLSTQFAPLEIVKE